MPTRYGRAVQRATLHRHGTTVLHCTRARADKVDVIIIEIDSPGGLLGTAETMAEDIAALDESIARLRARHEAQFAAMNAAVASLKETEKALDNMMEAWMAGLKNS